MRSNRREVIIGAFAVAVFSAPSLASVDYGDPDVEFRDFNVAGVPASGPYNPLRADGEKWCERLGLPRPNAWHLYRDQYGLVNKHLMRAECHKWLADHAHRCTMADIT